MRFTVVSALFLLAAEATTVLGKSSKRCQSSFNAPNVAPHAGSNNKNSTSSGGAPTNNSTATDTPGYNSSNDGSSTNDTASASEVKGKVFSVEDKYAGDSFFDGFDFETFADPTHGNVNYVSQSQALDNKLAYVQDDGVAVMKVDNTSTVQSGGNRDSVRITSKKSYSTGLFVLDVASMPTGCATWPAFWLVGPNWPAGGEIDILEGVNENVNAQYTLHTNPGCNLDTSFEKSASKRKRSSFTGKARHTRRAMNNAKSALAFTGTILTSNCDATSNSNTGCGVRDPSDQSYGAPLNAAGGGVFATLLDSTGVAIWFFTRSSIPKDLTSGKPQPTGWGSPRAFWSSTSCPSSTYFRSQQIVINTTLCGDWAGAAYSSSGCPGTCADRVANPKNFDNAQWKINSVIVYS
ncbi:hypothetical protein FRB93_002155 [Tulasnella sp. JGI-2019a]|nr:hypothetical protein FRB93_002155 [Tulasnella sp. JGI-2019a]